MVLSKGMLMFSGWPHSYKLSDILVSKAGLNIHKVCVDVPNETTQWFVLDRKGDKLFKLLQVLALDVFDPPLLVKDLLKDTVVISV
jgi:hypothetical protein